MILSDRMTTRLCRVNREIPAAWKKVKAESEKTLEKHERAGATTA